MQPCSPGAATPSANLVSNAVAVIDFTMAGEANTADHWVIGLADLMALELEQQDIPVFERRSIRFLLAERRLARIGLSDWHQLAQQKLPQLQFLVCGEMRRLTDLHYHLTVSLTEVRSGREAASFDHQGVYPGDVFTGLRHLAQQIATRINQGLVPSVVRKAPAGFTQKPEVALLFYKGMEHCLTGRPEWAALYFMEAQNADPSFLATKVWKLRAFQMLGIPEFIQACRDEMSSSTQHAAALANLDKVILTQNDRLHLALAAGLRTEQDLASFGVFKQELQKQAAFSLFDPQAIDRLTRELDLQLSENPGDPFDLATMAWTAVDAIIHFRVIPEAGVGGTARQVQVEGRDALSGALLFSVQSAARQDEMGPLGQKVSTMLIQRHLPAANPNPHLVTVNGSLATPYEALNLSANFWTNRAPLAQLLKCMSQYPKDRRPVIRLQGLFRNGQARLERANWDHYLATIDPADPLAATRTAAVLWIKRGFYSPTSIKDDFALLFQRYPESLEALNGQSAQALESFEKKDYQQAVELWIHVFKKLLSLEPTGLVKFDYWANAYFFAAAACYELKRYEQANDYLQRAESILNAHPQFTGSGMILNGLTPDDHIDIRWVSHFREDHPYFGPEKTLRDAAGTLRQKLTAINVQPQSSTISTVNLEQLLQEAEESDGVEAWQKDLEFVRALIHHKNLNPTEYAETGMSPNGASALRQISLGYTALAGNYTLSTKLLLTAMGKMNQLARLSGSQEQRQDLDQLGAELARGLSPILSIRCYQASGQYEQALSLVEQALSQRPTQELIMIKRTLLRAVQGPVASGEYLRSEMVKCSQSQGVASPFQLAREAGIDFWAAGLYERAGGCYAQLLTLPINLLEAYRLSAQFHQAESEFRAGDAFQAAELLRAVMKAAEGKKYPVSGITHIGHSPADLFSLSANALQKMRFLSQMHCRSFEWEPKQAFDLFAVIPPSRPLAPAEADLFRLLLMAHLRRTPNSYSQNLPVQDYVKQYGRAAVPVLLNALHQEGVRPPESAIISGILNQVASVEDAPAVLAAFRHCPDLAAVALRLDLPQARAIIEERFPIYYQSHYIPYQFNPLIAQYKLRETYPVLIANFAENNLLPPIETQYLDRILTNDPVPDRIQDFGQALERRLEKLLAAQQLNQLAIVAPIAIKYGVVAGIAALFQCQDMPKEKILSVLRPHIDLPQEDTAAWQWLETHRGRLTWNSSRKKYEPKP